MISTSKFFFFADEWNCIWRVDQAGPVEPQLVVAKPLFQKKAKTCLSTAFNDKWILYPDLEFTRRLKMMKISSKGELFHPGSIHLEGRKKRCDRNPFPILDIQVAGKNQDKIFLVTHRSVRFLIYCFKAKKVLSRSIVTRYMIGHVPKQRFNCMSVSDEGEYAFVLEANSDFDNVALHVLRVRWDRRIRRAYLFRFGESPLKKFQRSISFA